MIELENDNVRIVVNPLGAEQVELNILSEENLLWKPNNIHWNRVAPHLFPIVGRLKNNSFTHEGKTFEMSQHGFARDHVFELIEKDDNRLTFELKSNENTLEKYPFDFVFRVHYTLVTNGVEVVYETINSSEKEMYYSVGAHPGFQLKDTLDSYYLSFGKPMELERQILQNAHYSGEKEIVSVPEKWFLTDELFEEDAFVVFDPTFESIELGHIHDGKLLTLNAKEMTAIGFWTRKGAPFFCIEPWWGYADLESSTGEISQKAGIRCLKSGASERLTYSVLV